MHFFFAVDIEDILQLDDQDPEVSPGLYQGGENFFKKYLTFFNLITHTHTHTNTFASFYLLKIFLCR